MPLSEFQLIEKYFTTQSAQRDDVVLGIGDDAALLQIPADKQLVVATDTLVSDVHFFADANPADIAYKALAVNLSDMAAMGATPAWVTLALTLPEANETWLQKFSAGFFALAKQHQVQLIGGDITQGPLTVTVQIQGLITPGKALLRSGAQVGDLIYVTGELGAASFALRDARKAEAMQRLLKPQPRIAEAQALLDLASSAIDISDGLAADLSHILTASQVGAQLELAKLPIAPVVANNTIPESAIQLALSGGDDYELCFTVPATKQAELATALANFPCGYHQIGVIEPQPGLRMLTANGAVEHLKPQGYQHF